MNILARCYMLLYISLSLLLLLLLFLLLLLVVIIIIIIINHYYYAHAHTHKQVNLTAISKPIIFHVFYNCKPSACRPCRAKDCTAGTVFDLVQIKNQIEIQGFGINGSSDFHLEGFLKHLMYQLLRKAGDYYQSTRRHIAEYLNFKKHSRENFK